jgi:hypothetical protein
VKEFQIDEFKSLHDLLANYRDDKKWIFRSQADKGTYRYQVSTRENLAAAMGTRARQLSALQVGLPGDRKGCSPAAPDLPHQRLPAR